MQAHINQLRGFNCHYVRKENILFPYLEQVWDDSRPLQVMWSLHDDIGCYWKELDQQLEEAGDIEADIGYKLVDILLARS
ncbi:MAG: hemerythrin domain-containing protein [Bacillota bacterium]